MRNVVYVGADVVRQGKKTLHGLVLHVMECNTPWRAVLRSLLDVDGILRVPILAILWILGESVIVMVARHKGHVPLAAIIVLCVVWHHAHFAKDLCHHGILGN